MSYYEFEYEAPIERLPIGNGQKILYYQVVILPDDLCRLLPFDIYPKLRIIGEIGDHPVRGAWNPIADGRKYFILSKTFLQQAELQVGDMTEIRFNIDDQNYVEVPDEITNIVTTDLKFAEKWDNLTAGKKRFYCHQIATAKQQSTRDKRVSHLINELLAEDLPKA